MPISDSAKLVVGNVYVDGAVLIGTVEMELPEITMEVADISPMGAAGSLDMPLPKVEKMTSMIKSFAPNANAAAAALGPNTTVAIEARGSYKTYNAVNGAAITYDRVSMLGNGAGLAFGTRNNTDSEVDHKFHAYQVEYFIDGVEILHVNVPNGEYRVNGVDYLETHRNNI